jgi:hypothetical protein
MACTPHLNKSVLKSDKSVLKQRGRSTSQIETRIRGAISGRTLDAGIPKRGEAAATVFFRQYKVRSTPGQVCQRHPH